MLGRAQTSMVRPGIVPDGSATHRSGAAGQRGEGPAIMPWWRGSAAAMGCLQLLRWTARRCRSARLPAHKTAGDDTAGMGGIPPGGTLSSGGTDRCHNAPHSWQAGSAPLCSLCRLLAARLAAVLSGPRPPWPAPERTFQDMRDARSSGRHWEGPAPPLRAHPAHLALLVAGAAPSPCSWAGPTRSASTGTASAPAGQWTSSCPPSPSPHLAPPKCCS